ncbi:MAG: bacillithiol system redox-active protein YtxJ [Hymenobacteraceae bacterium]|nr:bacillithiol system redox-active protein YtxJ [Hymenobacteraceae bacterium]MDX5396699.1 bacillithiol system redox-active protein YtxJ [Hymenobacteraceae bacterium]MDX5442960.1 bacillithiol system redox-active protein YtxJ [Hymenobacteraceae bacterium]MDX5512759.1 bacillithiol system redox-active protein YtxJ [Hymenobacteraceae bacterium]
MQWHPLTSEEQLQHLKDESKEAPIVIFKHSTACSISSTAKSRLERQWHDAGLDFVKPYYLDLLAYRPVSNQIANEFGIRHESPQLLLIRDGACVYDASHLNIRLDDLKKRL